MPSSRAWDFWVAGFRATWRVDSLRNATAAAIPSSPTCFSFAPTLPDARGNKAQASAGESVTGSTYRYISGILSAPREGPDMWS